MAAIALSGCGALREDDAVERSLQGVNVVDESNLNAVMLTVGDPEEAVAYFRRTLTEDPDRIDIRRGLAKSLVRARRIEEAQASWESVVSHPDANDEDAVDYADALIRGGAWDAAKAVLDSVPPTHETYRRYRLEAMVADVNGEWDKADSFYEIAAGLSTLRAPVLNNWGYSKLSRGDSEAAERLFQEAIRNDPKLFTAKNNLVMARGAQGRYALPVMPMTQTERAQLLHTLALAAIKRGDVTIGKGLLREAIDTHPQYFDAAHRALRALETGATG
jgi:Flp pilus assembly protein TadD